MTDVQMHLYVKCKLKEEVEDWLWRTTLRFVHGHVWKFFLEIDEISTLIIL